MMKSSSCSLCACVSVSISILNRIECTYRCRPGIDSRLRPVWARGLGWRRAGSRPACACFHELLFQTRGNAMGGEPMVGSSTDVPVGCSG